ncbi:MAG TPA: Ig-like domain-containing protein, partial [Acidimicrobiales bacterium]|nr:Ig-like domain-containing protein [Acidimicrobiales bacterium]
GPHGFDTRFGHGVVDALAALGGAAPAARPDVAGEAAEPNDEPSRATTLAAPATGSINPEGDEDWFGLDLTGGTYTLTVQPPPPDSMDDPRGLDAIIELFGPDLAPLAAADWTGLDDTETLTFSVAGAGHYLARVRNWSGTVSPGAYGITLEGGASGDGSLGPPTALSLSDTVPADRALAVAASTSPSLVFARPVNPATVSGATVRLLDGRTLAPVAATVTLDGAATTATVDPTGSLAAGPYLVQVDGVADSLGSPMAATAVRFTVGTPDLAPPGTVITAAPASTTAVQAAGFSFGSPDGGTAFECRVDSQDWWACSSAASVVVSPGPHTFDVMARDAAGNEDPSPASASWTFAPPATAAPARTSVQQYTLANSDGTTWVPIDAANPANVTTQFPATTTGKALVTANVDLWTFTAGFNQDLAIFSSVDGGPFALVAWKESGGFAGTFSPNAAAVQALVPVTAGSTYQFQLRWKTNKGGTSTIAAGAGPVSGSFSPTSIVVRQAPDAAAATAGVSTQQYTLTNSNGTTWVPVDAAALTTRVTPASAGTATVTANADLWTWDAGFNQDLAIFMSVDSGAYGLVAWKESGGFAGTFSPNAASVQAQVPVGAGSTYDFQLRWKANKPGTSRISAGAGPIAGAFSPTSIVAVVNPTATAASYSATSTAQYTMENGNGSAWLPVDAAALTVDLPAPGTACSALVTANADLWTWTAGFNQDIALFARQADGPWSMVAWKESGGFAGTFSPNAAAVQAVVPMAAGSTYQVQLRWKANKSGASKISAGAGPIDGDFSPTSVVARTSGC